MPANTGDFNAGAGKPVPNPAASNFDENGILKPIAPSTGSSGPRAKAEPYTPVSAEQARAAARQGIQLDTAASAPKPSGSTPSLVSSLRQVETVTGKRVVKMNDTIRIVEHLGSQLLRAHLDLSKNGKHPKHDEVAAGLNAAASSIAFAKQKKDTETPLAWEHIAAAGKALHAVTKDLHSVDPISVADIHSPHSINGVETRFTPGAELLQITRQPSEFRTQGRPVNRVALNGKVVKLPKGVNARIRANQQSAQKGIKGYAPIRKDLLEAFDQKQAGMPRTRRADRRAAGIGGEARTGATSPLSSIPMVESTGIAAVQPSKVGDWSGAEQTPKSGVPAESLEQKRVTKKRVGSAKRRAVRRARKAGEK